MKKTYFIEFYKTIKQKLVSFISILIFVALSVGMFTGIGWAGSATQHSMENIFKNTNMYDYMIYYPYGLNDKEINDLKKLDYVDDVQGVYNSYNFFQNDGKKYQAKITSLSKKIAKPYAVFGKLPVKSSEIAVENNFAKLHDLKIGDTIKFEHDLSDYPHIITDILNKNDTPYDKCDDKDNMQYLCNDTFKITAFLDYPDNINIVSNTYGSSPNGSIPVDCLMYTNIKAFDKNCFDGYPINYITFKNLKNYYTFEKKYKFNSNKFIKDIKKISNKSSLKKSKKIKNFATSLFNEKEKMINDGKNNLSNLKNIIDDSENKIKKGGDDLELLKKTIAEKIILYNKNSSELFSREQLYNEKKVEFDNTYNLYLYNKEYIEKGISFFYEKKSDIQNFIALYNNLPKDSKSIIEFLKTNLTEERVNDIKAKITILAIFYPDKFGNILEFINKFESGYYDKNMQEIVADIDLFIQKLNHIIDNLDNYVEQIKDTIRIKDNEFENGKKLLNDSQIQINDAKLKLKQAKKLLNDYQRKYDDGILLLTQNTKQLDDIKSIYTSKTLEINKATQKLNSSKKVFSQNFKNIKSKTISRDLGCSYSTIKVLSNVFFKLRYTMALLFVVVGLLVCYSALSRIVKEQSIIIGTKKSLGLNNFEITFSFVMFSAISCFIGCVIGVFLGIFVVEKILLNTLTRTMAIYNPALFYSIKDIILVCLLEFCLIIITTYFSCRSILKKKAVTLLSGQNESLHKKHFYEKTKMFKNKKIISKIIINNLANDKRRVIGTLIGITGITSLVVCAFSMKNNVDKSLDTHFSKIQNYTTVIYVDKNKTNSIDEVQKLLKNENIDSCKVLSELGTLNADNTKTIAYYNVPFQDNYNKFFKIYSKNNNKLKNPKNGVWISEPVLYKNNIKAGDYFEYSKPFDKSYKYKISGFFESYLTRNFVLISKNEYVKTFKKDAKPNALLINKKYNDIIKINNKLSKIDGFLFIDDYYTKSIEAFKSFSSISGILLSVYVSLSIVMAVLVLLNLLKMFVDEKKKEIIVLRINGFDKKITKRYIYLDTLVLTIIGIVFGIVLGSIMGSLTVRSFETLSSHFIKSISLISCFIGICICSILTYIMCKIALRKTDKFKLSDINNE